LLRPLCGLEPLPPYKTSKFAVSAVAAEKVAVFRKAKWSALPTRRPSSVAACRQSGSTSHRPRQRRLSGSTSHRPRQRRQSGSTSCHKYKYKTKRTERQAPFFLSIKCFANMLLKFSKRFFCFCLMPN